MTNPQTAVDGDEATAWTAGPDGRMVVDLGAAQRISEIRAQWRGSRIPASPMEWVSR
ncbi:discoidin domain-containing protein [Streptomyces sp. NPDC058239]|uniref:discoidin domain-containing protein n=1 Tax=Streptomyces sp. NPDC058239 TaxID=3346395 RepID=UPI0036E087EB